MEIPQDLKLKIELSTSDITDIIRKELAAKGYDLDYVTYKNKPSDSSSSLFFKKQTSSHFDSLEIKFRKKIEDFKK